MGQDGKRRQTLAAAVLLAPWGAVLASGDEGLYLGLGGHESRVDVRQIDGGEVSVQASMGFRFNRFFGTELGMYDLGRFRESATVGPYTGNAEYSGWLTGIAAVPRLPLGIFDLYARLGVAYYDVDTTVVTSVGGVKDSESGFDIYGGAGASVNIGSHWSVYLDYTAANAGELVEMVGLGARFHFD